MTQFDDEGFAKGARRSLYKKRSSPAEFGVVFSWGSRDEREILLARVIALAKKRDGFKFFYKKRVHVAFYIDSTTIDEVSFSGVNFSGSSRTKTISYFAIRETILTKIDV